MCKIIGITPGPRTSGQVVVDDTAWPPTVLDANPAAKDYVLIWGQGDFDDVVVKWMTSYGDVVGADVLDTARLVGRLEERTLVGRERGFHLIKAPDIRYSLAGDRHASDAQIKEAIREIYRGAGLATGGGSDPCKGVKAHPGPLYGVTSHSWDALAVVLAWMRAEGMDER